MNLTIILMLRTSVCSGSKGSGQIQEIAKRRF
jgi:hypothetical protein